MTDAYVASWLIPVEKFAFAVVREYAGIVVYRGPCACGRIVLCVVKDVRARLENALPALEVLEKQLLCL